MLSIRKRGKKFHIRGTIRVGRETRIVQEHSTGCDRREDADAYRSKLEADIRHEVLYGRGGRTQNLTVADAGLRYMARPGGLRSYDLWRLDQINKVVGDRTIAEAAEAWVEFRRTRCAGLSPATVQRFRASFQAAVNYLAAEERFDPPKLPRGERINNKRVRFLSPHQADRLVQSYAEHVQPIATVLRWQGLRIGEALRLDWAHVSWAGNSIFIAETKGKDGGEPRTVTMHKHTRAALHRVWVSRRSPKEGRVFLAPFYLPSVGKAQSFDWSNVNWSDGSIVISEGRETRAIRLRRRTLSVLRQVWTSHDAPDKGRVFLAQLGVPYADARASKFPSGSGIKKAHGTACRRAGITDFHVHDWRHHWACWCVMSGIDLETIKQEGGWKSLRMVERYASVSAAHRTRAMTKLK
jgi:integrase